MYAIPVSRHTSTVQQDDGPASPRALRRRRDTSRQAQEREEQARLVAEGKPLSGRHGPYVYYWAYGHLCWRLYVVPKDPHTVAQRRCRTAFGTGSRAFSANDLLTEEQRNAWRAEAAKTKSAPRLGQSGVLAAQQYFVGRNCTTEQVALGLLLEPSKPAPQKASPQRQGTEFIAEVCAPESFARPTCEPPAAPAAVTSSPRRSASQCLSKSRGNRLSSQPKWFQILPQPSSERPRSNTTPPPLHSRSVERPTLRSGRISSPRLSCSLACRRRTARFRELWRGG